ncbi:glycosyl hydrolase family 18 protein [Chitinophaga sp. RCC_12]|uniref:glycosyl hydrolase family 18 protein n=1 Tax=Chitinophaga sp. RCC_12 TaxID=3239226 RepID=UPI00352456D6
MKQKLVVSTLLVLLISGCTKIRYMLNAGKPAHISTLQLDETGFKIVAYLPKYTSTLADHINAFDFSKVTHLNIAFFNPDVNGNFPASQGTGLDTIVSKAHLNNVKVLLSLGGGSNQSQYANLLTSTNRAAFITKVVNLVSQYHVDGIDVDLEGDNIDENYEAFITGLSAQLKPNGKLLTAAVAWWTRDRVTDSCLAAFDFINVMAYDKAGDEHSPYSYAKQHVEYWKGQRGLAAAKIVVGVPFYGLYTLSGNLQSMKYSEITAQYPGSENKDTVRRPDGAIVNYNGIPTIQNKTAYAQQEAGGIMFWQVLQDATGSLSLLNAIHDKINSSTGWEHPYITWKFDLSAPASATFADSTAAKASVSVKGTPGFLPAPPYGYGRVFLPATCGGYFQLQPGASPPSLKIAASSTNTPAKLSWYNIDEAKPLAALTFNLNLNAALTNGQLIIPFGYSTTSSSTFNNTNQLTSVSTPGVFAAIRLDFYGGNFATLSYRNATFGYTTINNTVFNKTGNYKIELYCNNSSAGENYTKGASTYALPAQTYNLWVNDALIQGASSLTNFPATGELATLSTINSFSFNASGNTGTPGTTPPTSANSLLATLNNIFISFDLKN